MILALQAPSGGGRGGRQSRGRRELAGSRVGSQVAAGPGQGRGLAGPHAGGLERGDLAATAKPGPGPLGAPDRRARGDERQARRPRPAGLHAHQHGPRDIVLGRERSVRPALLGRRTRGDVRARGPRGALAARRVFRLRRASALHERLRAGLPRVRVHARHGLRPRQRRRLLQLRHLLQGDVPGLGDRHAGDLRHPGSREEPDGGARRPRGERRSRGAGRPDGPRAAAASCPAG